MNTNKQPVNSSLSEIVRAVLDIDDRDLINNVIDVLITPKKVVKKNRSANFYQSQRRS